MLRRKGDGLNSSGTTVAKRGRSWVWRRDAVEADIRRGEFRSVGATKARRTIEAERARQRFYALKNEGPIPETPRLVVPIADSFDAGPDGQTTHFDPNEPPNTGGPVDETPAPVVRVETKAIEIPAVRDIRPSGEGDGDLIVTVYAADRQPMTLHGVRVVVTDATVLA